MANSFLLPVIIFSLSALPNSDAVEKGKVTISYEKPTDDSVLVNCAYCGEEKNPAMAMENGDSNTVAMNTYVDNTYNVEEDCYMVNMKLLMLDSMLPKETIFECKITDSETGQESRKTMEYVPSSSSRIPSSHLLLLILPVIIFSSLTG